MSGFQKGHKTNVGRKHSQQALEKMRLSQSNEKNPRWKGDSVGYEALHDWVRSHLQEPKLCEFCNIKPPKHLANITGNYNREFKNWKYLCRSCHIRYDGNPMLGRKHTEESKQKMRKRKARGVRV